MPILIQRYLPLVVLLHLSLGIIAQVLQSNPSDANNDGVSNDAPGVEFYAGLGADIWGGEDPDPHGVHGIETEAGGLVVVGKYAKSSYAGGFVTGIPTLPSKYKGGYHGEMKQSDVWVYKFGKRGVKGEGFANGANQVVEVGSHLFAVGFMAASNNRVDSYIVKLKTATGEKVWEMKIEGKNGKTSALEGIAATSNGGIICSGLTDANNVNCLEGFKSYGNPVCGKAQLVYLSPSQVNSNSAPSNPTWTKKYSGLISGKSVREISSTNGGGYVFVASQVDPEGVATIVKTTSNGEKVWETITEAHGEVTDVSVIEDADKVYFMMSGHGGNGSVLHGRLSKVDGDSGSVIWTKSYGEVVGGKAQFTGITNGNPNDYIFHECWGIANAPDEKSVVLGCGTGIEGCKGQPNDCKKDPRTVWRSLLLDISVSNGEVLWHRMDSFGDNKSNDVGDSASEYAFLTKDGRIFSTNDEGFGVGLLMTEPLGDSQKCEEKQGDKFYLKDKKKNGEVVGVKLKKCSWLKTLSAKTLKKKCKKTKGTNENGPAQEVCPVSCNKC